MRRFKHIPTNLIACFENEEAGYWEESKQDVNFFLTKGKDWEEIKEYSKCNGKGYIGGSVKYEHKEWEITAFNFNGEQNSILFARYKHSDFPPASGLPIASVKRLSDGVEFKVGDKIRIGGNNGLIEKFFYEKNGVIVHTTNSGGHLGNAKKLDFLFVTEDGVKIYVGDDYYVAWSDKFGDKNFHWNSNPNPTQARDNINYSQIANREHGVFWFSTKNAAEQFIIMNKPVLSIQSIINEFAPNEDNNIFFNLDTIKTLVKSKL